MLKVNIFYWINILHMLHTAYSGCILNIHGNSPIFMKRFGHKKVIFAEKLGAIRLEEGETIQAHCSTSISLQATYSTNHDSDSVRSKELQCFQANRFRYKTLDERNFVEAEEGELYISCSDKLNRFLYESELLLPNCKNQMSYAIGIALPNVKDIITAGICYDLNTLKLKYINYLAYRPKYEYVTSQQTSFNIQTVSLDKRLTNLESYFTFMSKRAFDEAIAVKKTTNPLLNYFDFDYGSLVQDSQMSKEFAEFENIFTIIWWRNLRIGNWKYYLEALEERTKMVNYHVFLGITGENSVPQMVNNTNGALAIQADGITVKAPEYIWAYLKSLHANVTEEFVLIAYNSPYHNDTKSTIFCSDMCDDMEWIKKSLFGRIRLMPTLGLMFCCRPEEVAAKFPNFPSDKKFDNSVVSQQRKLPKASPKIIPSVIKKR